MRFAHECALNTHLNLQIFYCLHKSIEYQDRQYVVNMKAIGVVVMTQSAMTLPLVLNGRTCCVQYLILRRVPSTNTLRGLNYDDNKGHYINV